MQDDDPPDLAEPRRESVVGQIADGQRGEGLDQGRLAERFQQNPPADRPEPDAEHQGHSGQADQQQISLADQAHDLFQISTAQRQPQKEGADRQSDRRPDQRAAAQLIRGPPEPATPAA
ncbi:MAG TPA: hypothetical protein QGG37_07360 [Chloroflexota bacterium]|nr:hypothetical protein [Chloroflexota bacterium]